MKHTKRLIIREFKENDWTAVHRYAILPEVVRFMPWGPNTEEQTKQFIERARLNITNCKKEYFDCK